MVSDAPPPRADGPLTGHTVVITGGLEAFSRDDAKRAVVGGGRQGDRLGEQVRPRSWSPASIPASKLQKAESAGVPVLDEAAFLAILDGSAEVPSRGREEAAS